jgi:hypothetical protein
VSVLNKEERDRTANLRLWFEDALVMARAIASVQGIVENYMEADHD